MATRPDRVGRATPGAAVPVAVDFVENSSLAAPSAPHDADIATLRQELAALRAEFAAFRTAMMSPAMMPPATNPAADAHGVADAAAGIANTPATGIGAPTSATSGTSRRSRRSLLKWGGLGAAAAVAAAGGTALTTQTAHAATGDTMVLGQYNVAETNSKIALDSTAPDLYGLIVDAESSPVSTGIWAIGGNNGIGVKAQVEGASGGYGVYSSTGIGVGVYGGALTTGGSGFGVHGEAVGGTGVYGYSQTSFGIVGESRDFISLGAGGTGRFSQSLTASAGAPTSGGHYNSGEQIRDSAGELWLCTVSGTPGTWVKAAHVLAGYSGGVTNYLSKPIRLLDSRPGATDAKNNGGGPYATGSTHSLTVAGVSFTGVTIPAVAVGAIGNVTVVTQPGANGNLALVPHGAGFTGTAVLAYGASQVVSNSYNLGLSGGELDIIIGGTGSTNVIIDVFAVVA
jgi:hypothetical protein